MVSSNEMKKEAAEVRKMIAASRLAKKQAAAKARKQKKAGSAPTPSVELTEKEKAKLRMRKGVLITKADLLSSSTATPAAAASPAGKGGKKGAKKDTAAAPAGVSTVEPPYNYEVHHKKALVTIRVTLHKVPPTTIDISQTTAKQFVLQTPKFTKKFFLSFPFPGNLEVVPAKAEYTFDMGILTCILPIKDGALPSEMVAEREEFLKKVTSQKAMRFRIGKEGELVVRTRQALLPAELQKPKGKAAATTKDAKVETTDKKEDNKAAKKAPVAEAKKKAAVTAAATKEGQKVLQAAKQAAAKVAGTMTLTTEGKAAAAAKNANNAKKPAAAAAPQAQGVPRKQFVADGAAMLAMADAAGAVVKNKLYENIQKAKELQVKKMTRVNARQDKSEVKKEKQDISFARVLAEQKRMLLQKMEDQKPVAPKAPKSGAPAKQVKFA